MQVSDYITAFQQSLIQHLPGQEVGHTSRLFIVGEYVARNKRDIYLYISHDTPEKATSLTLVKYLLPVPANNSLLFIDEERVLPSVGPSFTVFDDLLGLSLANFVQTHAATFAGIEEWHEENSRIQDMAEVESVPIRKQTMKNIIIFWKNMRIRVYRALSDINIRVPRTVSGKLRSKTRSRSGSVHTNASNVKSQRSTSRSRVGSSGRRSSPRPNSLSNHQSDPKPAAD